MKSAYVYYRVDLTWADAAARIDELMGMMTAHCGHPPARQIRCDDPAMWMEIYEGIADFPAFATALQLAVETIDCGAFIRGDRHLECFSDSDL